MPFQVIPGPTNNEGIEALTKFQGMILASKQQAINEQLAHSRLQSEQLQNELLSQDVANYPTWIEQRNRLGESEIARSQASTRQLDQAGLESQERVKASTLGRTSQMWEMIERGLTTVPRLRETFARSSDAVNQAEISRMNLADAKQFQKEGPAIFKELHPDAAMKVASFKGMELYGQSQVQAQQIKTSAAQANAAAIAAELQRRSFELDRGLKMAAVTSEFANKFSKDPEQAEATLGALNQLAPEIAKPLQTLSQIARDTPNFLQVLGWASMQADPEVQAKFLEYQQVQHPQNYREVSESKMDSNLNTVILPSTQERTRALVDDLAKAYQKSKGKTPTTKPVADPISSGAPTSLKETRQVRQTQTAFVNRLKQSDKRIQSGFFDASAGEQTLQNLQTDVIQDVSSKLGALDVQKKLDPILGQIEPIGTSMDEQIKRGRFYETLRHIFSTGRPGLVLDTLIAKYGTNSLLETDQELIKALNEEFGWNWTPKPSEKK